jgi:hypothetical protein
LPTVELLCALGELIVLVPLLFQLLDHLLLVRSDVKVLRLR